MDDGVEGDDVGEEVCVLDDGYGLGDYFVDFVGGCDGVLGVGVEVVV